MLYRSVLDPNIVVVLIEEKDNFVLYKRSSRSYVLPKDAFYSNFELYCNSFEDLADIINKKAEEVKKLIALDYDKKY